MSRFGLFFLYAVALTLTLSYAIALPLWEGFDEPFHYANVVQYSVDRSLTSLPRSRVSEEIRRSFADAPASHLVFSTFPKRCLIATTKKLVHNCEWR